MSADTPEPELDLVIVGRDELADGVVALTLAAADGTALPVWEPGAHIDIVLPDDLRRQYSLCGDPADEGTWRIAVLLEPNGRGGSRHVHEHLHVGEPVTAKGPRNHFALVEAPSYLFIAGGIGITPILPMLRRARAAGADYRLVYGGRARTSMAFVDELTGEHGEQVSVRPQDEFGLLDLPGILSDLPADAAIYTCGPGPLLDAVEKLEGDHSTRLHMERFVPKPQDDDDGALAEFEVRLTQSQCVLKVLAGQSILKTVEDAGIYVEASCREGTCGTCETAIVSGRAAHRDSLLSAAEQEANESMMICVGRSYDPELVLDL